jgi:hypothetical protein
MLEYVLDNLDYSSQAEGEDDGELSTEEDLLEFSISQITQVGNNISNVINQVNSIITVLKIDVEEHILPL